MEKDNQPGSARRGNFINYYSFNPPERRISLLPGDFITDIIGGGEETGICALDIGCNAGVSFQTGPVNRETCRYFLLLLRVRSSDTSHDSDTLTSHDSDTIQINDRTLLSLRVLDLIKFCHFMIFTFFTHVLNLSLRARRSASLLMVTAETGRQNSGCTYKGYTLYNIW